MNDMREAENQLQQKDIDYLAKEVAELKATMNTGFALVYTKLDMFYENYVKRTDLDLILKSRDEKVEDLRSNQKWVVRAVIGIVITAIMGTIILYK